MAVSCLVVEGAAVEDGELILRALPSHIFIWLSWMMCFYAGYDRDAHVGAEAVLFDGLPTQRQKIWEAASFPERNRYKNYFGRMATKKEQAQVFSCLGRLRAKWANMDRYFWRALDKVEEERRRDQKKHLQYLRKRYVDFSLNAFCVCVRRWLKFCVDDC